jgi:hypothetical protein
MQAVPLRPGHLSAGAVDLAPQVLAQIYQSDGTHGISVARAPKSAAALNAEKDGRGISTDGRRHGSIKLIVLHHETGATMIEVR